MAVVPAHGSAFPPRPTEPRSAAGDLVERRQGIEGTGIADERDEYGEHAQQPGAVVAHVEVTNDVSFDLGVAAAEGGEHGEGEQFAGRHVDAGTGQVVTEAVSRQIALQMLLVVRRGRIHPVDPFAVDNLLLPRQPAFEPGRGGRRRLAGERQPYPALGEYLV